MKNSIKNHSIRISRCFIIFLIALTNLSILFSQDNNFFLEDMETNSDPNLFVGLSIMQLPKELVRDEISQIPMVEISYRYDIDNNFSLLSSVSSCYIINTLSLEANYKVNYKKFSLSLGNELKYWFSQLQMSGFDVTTNGLINTPNISAGYDFGDFKITARAEANYFLNNNFNFGSSNVSKSSFYLMGSSISFYLEQPVFQNSDFLLGAQLAMSEPSYQVWVAEPTSNDWVLIPKLLLGIKL
jgi:hypothetical protein